MLIENKFLKKKNSKNKENHTEEFEKALYVLSENS